MSAHEKILQIERSGELPPAARAGNDSQEPPDGRLGTMLVEAGKLQRADVERVMALQRTEGLRFGEAAVKLSLISANDVQRAVARQYKFSVLPPDEGISPELVAAIDPNHARTEELRTLRTQLLIRWYNAGIRQRVMAIVSPGSGEGRSYLAANLAVVFAQVGERTLLIDGDMRAPRQHRIFNVSNRVGLSTVLSGRAGHGAIVGIPGFESLALLPAGSRPPNPQELLLRPTFTALLDKLADDYDVILLDTPPAAQYADAQGLAFRAGSALMIMRQNHTTVSDTSAVVHEFQDTGINIVGTLLNAF